TLAGGPRVPSLKVVLDELAEALVGEGPVLLDEAPIQDPDLPDRGEVLQLLEEPRLSDTGLTRDHRELALPADGRVQEAVKLGELFFPADDDGGRGPRDDAARGQDDGHPELVAVEARLVATQRLGHLARLLGTLVRILLEASHQDVLKLLANFGAEVARRLRDLVHDAIEDGLDLSRERRLADEAFIKNHT